MYNYKNTLHISLSIVYMYLDLNHPIRLQRAGLLFAVVNLYQVLYSCYETYNVYSSHARREYIFYILTCTCAYARATQACSGVRGLGFVHSTQYSYWSLAAACKESVRSGPSSHSSDSRISRSRKGENAPSFVCL